MQGFDFENRGFTYKRNKKQKEEEKMHKNPPDSDL